MVAGSKKKKERIIQRKVGKCMEIFFLKTEKNQSIIMNNNICLYICVSVKDQLSEP